MKCQSNLFPQVNTNFSSFTNCKSTCFISQCLEYCAKSHNCTCTSLLSQGLTSTSSSKSQCVTPCSNTKSAVLMPFCSRTLCHYLPHYSSTKSPDLPDCSSNMSHILPLCSSSKSLHLTYCSSNMSHVLPQYSSFKPLDSSDYSVLQDYSNNMSHVFFHIVQVVNL